MLVLGGRLGVIAVGAALQVILRLGGLNIGLDAAHHAHQQQGQGNTGQGQEDIVGGVQGALHRVHISGQTGIGGHLLVHGLGRRDDGGLSGLGGGQLVSDADDVALEGLVFAQLVLHPGVEPVLAGHGYMHITGEFAGLASQDGREVVQVHAGGIHVHVGHIHGAGIGDLHVELHHAGQGINHFAVGGGFHIQHDDLAGVHGGDGHALGGGFGSGAAGILALDGELIISRLGDGELLFQGHGLAGGHRLAGEDFAQHGIGDRHVLVVHIAGVFQGQGQLDGIADGTALLVGGQAGGKLHLAILDGGGGLLVGQGLAAGLVGDGGLAGQILAAHGGGEGIAGLFACGNGLDLAVLGGNGLVLLDHHVGDLYIAGVDHIIGHGHLLPLAGGGGGDDAVDLHVGHRAGVLDLVADVGGLVDQFACIVIHRVLQLEGDLTVLQLAFGNLPGARPGLGGTGSQGGGAELLNDLAIGIIKGHRAGAVRVADVGHLEGNGDVLGLGKLGIAQLDEDIQAVLLHGASISDAGKAQQHRHQNDQAYDQALFHCIVGRNSTARPPSASGH